jgi:hypothetical protein
MVSANDAADLLGELRKFGYNSLSELDRRLERSRDAFAEYETDFPPASPSGSEKRFTAAGVVRISLGIIDEEYGGKKYPSDHRLVSYRAKIKKA